MEFSWIALKPIFRTNESLKELLISRVSLSGVAERQAFLDWGPFIGENRISLWYKYETVDATIAQPRNLGSEMKVRGQLIQAYGDALYSHSRSEM